MPNLHRRLALITGALLLAPFAAWTYAGFGSHCQHCGCSCECVKVCRMVCEMKEVKKTCYTCKCEDFCVPGPSTRCNDDCCGHCPDCRDSGWIPSAACIKTKKIPVKHEEVIKKPTYRFVVEYLCPSCASCVEKSCTEK